MILYNSECQAIAQTVAKQYEPFDIVIQMVERQPYSYDNKWDAIDKLTQGDVVIFCVRSIRYARDVEFHEFLHCRDRKIPCYWRTKTKTKAVEISDFN